MSEFDGLMAGLACLGSPSGEGVGGFHPQPGSAMSSVSEHPGTVRPPQERGIADSKSIASPAPASEDALGWQGGGEHPINSSPLHKFGDVAQGRALSALLADDSGNAISRTESGPDGTGNPVDAGSSPAISTKVHSGDTITRLMDAVAVCEERSRR